MARQENEDRRRRTMLRLLMGAVTLWGALLALGAGLFGYDAATGGVHFAPNLLRGGIVLACVLVFLGIWVFLAGRRFR
jgi:hypothetical protein